MRFWIRADASPSIGIGHVMRTLACAQEAMSRGMSVEYVMLRDPHTNSIPIRHGCECRVVEKRDDQSWISEVTPGDVVLFDGYHFDSTDFVFARESGATVGAIDDFGYGEYPVDVLINQNLGRPMNYFTRADTRVLVGPRYAMVRTEFRARRRLRGHIANTLVISFGGSDVAGLSEQALEIALGSTFRHICLIVGPAADINLSNLPQKPKQIEIVRAPLSVAEVFDQADAAVSSAGSTTWELLCMGIPAVLVEVADNQAGIAASVANIGAGLFAGRPEELSKRLGPALQQLSSAGKGKGISQRCLRTVDGFGAGRVVEALMDRAS